MKKYIIGVDIGGTKIALGKLNDAGEIISKVVFKTEKEKGPYWIISRIIESVEKNFNFKKDEFFGIGIACGGPLDVENGIILSPPNLPQWDRIPIKSIFEENFKIKTILENDANASGLGEYLFGAGKGSRIMVYMTVSTGIGGAFIFDGEVYQGANFNGAEIGHMTIDLKGPLCGCGNFGCFEAMASGTALGKAGREAALKNPASLINLMVGSNIQKIDAKLIAECAILGDKTAKSLINREAELLGVGISNIVSIINPDTVIIGGGVSNSFDLMIGIINKTLKKRVMDQLLKVVTIKKSFLGENVGIIGAASLILKKFFLK